VTDGFPDLSVFYRILDNSDLLEVNVDVSLGPPVNEQIWTGYWDKIGENVVSTNALPDAQIEPSTPPPQSGDSEIKIIGIASDNPDHGFDHSDGST
jgi:hypothetical protein